VLPIGSVERKRSSFSDLAPDSSHQFILFDTLRQPLLSTGKLRLVDGQHGPAAVRQHRPGRAPAQRAPTTMTSWLGN